MVILGNHRDAWVFGAVDPNSGTAVLEEVARAFGTLRTKGWRPGRTIVLCSWDAEEYGLIGSTEWIEVGGREACLCTSHMTVCTHTGEAEGAWTQHCGLPQCGHCCGRYYMPLLWYVLFMHVHLSFAGSTFLSVGANPLLFKVLYTAAKLVCCDMWAVLC